jgi:iron complex outermembrane receptor protein
VTLVAAARGDWVRVPFEDLRDPDNSETSLFRRVSPRVAVRWNMRPQVIVYASAGTGFRAPAALELACASEDDPCPLPFSLGDDPPLAPVRARTVEAGADWTPVAWARASLSAYRTDVRDEIVLVQSERTAGFFRNLARTRRAGVEAHAELRGPVFHRTATRARLSYAWLDATYRSAAQLASQLEDAEPVRSGDRIPLNPAHRASAAVGMLRPLRAVTLDVELSLAGVSSQYLRGDEGNARAPLPGYAVAGARASLAWRRLTGTVHVGNLLDRRYASFGIWGENALAPDGSPLAGGEREERFLTPGMPRTVTLSLSIAR